MKAQIQSDAKTVCCVPQVGTISANGESEIGELIAKAMERVGKEGVITVEVGLPQSITPPHHPPSMT